MRVNNGLTPQELEAYGISDVHDIVYNPSYDLLYQEELDPSLTGYERGVLTNLGAVAVDTGIFTGRSPKDKYIVRDDTTRDTFWWADKGKATIVGITKAVCAYHCSGLDQAILTDLDLMVNGYVRPETRTCTDFAVFTYEATGTDNHVIAQFNAGLNHRVSANRYVVTQLRRRVDHRTGCNVLRGLRRGI